MVSSIIGSYLVECGVITSEQLRDVLYEQKKVRVKLGLIAVSEGLMSAKDAERVNKLQATMDKRFGDIAVAQGLLTEGQVEALLKKQGNAYMAFAQALEDMGLIDVDQLEQCLVDFKQEKNLTNSDLEAIKSDDADRIIPLYMPAGAEPYFEVSGVLLRTLLRLVDNDAYPEKAYLTDRLDADCAALQLANGNPGLTIGISGIGNSLLPLASIFGQAEFGSMDIDAIDAVAEFVNCVNGIYASAVSMRGIELDLLPPEYSNEISEVTSEKMLVFPLHVKGNFVNFLVSLNHTMKMN